MFLSIIIFYSFSSFCRPKYFILLHCWMRPCMSMYRCYRNIS